MGTMAFGRNRKVKAAFAAVKKDLDIHLDAINENTAEVYENRQMIRDLHERMCKVSDQLHALQLRLDNQEMQYPRNIELSLREQEIFLILYTANAPVGYNDVSRTLSRPTSQVQETVYGLIQKKIPVLKQRDEQGAVLLSLDIEFKEEQTKRNIVSIEPSVMQQSNRSFQLSLFD